MGDMQALLPQQNGNQYGSSPPNPHPSAIGAGSWRQAEESAEEVIHRLQPTVVSEQRRRAVIAYVQKLMRGVLGTEVLAFGSVPLKTYLLDGDIDLTAISVPNSEEALAREVQSALQIEEQNKDAEFEVKSVQYIHAEVKLVKCLVQNIVVDISFNQIGGLSTLCFLEQVDHLIGRNNLFKRSIILIKAWCYYESRILGAHHSLISTYALETLVLYIFHLFHSSLHGPLAVLYRFLDYYSKFDWDNYCISLYGPIPLASLPELVAEAPENDGGDLLLSKDFLQCCINMFSDSSRWLENNSRTFQQKHLNIVDPLKESNNLGRSVSKGNFYRIRSAFMYGARKLGVILGLPTEGIADEVNMFFMNALERHGSGERPDVQGDSCSLPDSTVSNYEVDSVSSELTVDICREDKLISGKPTSDSHGALSDKISKISISNSDKEHVTGIPTCEHPSNKEVNPSLPQKFTKTDSNGPVEPNVVSARLITDDAGDIATSKASGSGSSSSIETPKASVSHYEMFTSSSRKFIHAPHLFFHPEDGISARTSTPNQEISVNVHPDSYDTESSMRGTSWYDSQGIPIPSGSVDGSVDSSRSMYQSGFTHHLDCSLANDEGIGSNGCSKPNNLEDLTGDCDMHFKSLLYAQCSHENFLGRESFVGPHFPVFRPPSHYHSRHSWDTVRRHSMYAHMTANGVVSGPPFPSAGCHPVNSPLIPYGMENIPKQRGTGTYFPNANYLAYKERQHTGRGRNGVPGNQLQRSRSNVRAEMTTDTKNTEKTTLDLLAQVPASSGNDYGKRNGVPGNQLQRSRSNVRAEMTTDTKNTEKTTLDLLAQVPASTGNDCGKRNGVPGNQLQRSRSNVRAEMTTDTKNTEKTTLDLLAQVPASSGNDCGKRNGVPGNQLQRSCSNVRAEMTTDTKNTEKTTLDLLAQVPASSGNDCGKRNGVPGNQLQRSRSNVRAEMTTDTKNTDKTMLDLLAQVPASSANDCGKRNGVPGNQLQRSRSNVRAEMTTDTKNTDKTTLDLLAQVPASSGNDCGKPVPLDVPKSPQTVSKGLSDVCGFLFPPARNVEFGTFGPVPLGASSSAGKRLDSVSTQGQCSEPVSSASTVERPVANAILERRRQSYQLKDHNDFPPLTS